MDMLLKDARDSVRATSGLRSYDSALWMSRLPRLEHVVPATGGVSMLLQDGRALEPDTEVEVPEHPDHVLLMWRQGVPRLNCRIDGEEIRRRVPKGGAIFLPAGTTSWWHSDRSAADQLLHLHIDPGLMARVAEGEGMAGMAPAMIAGIEDPWLTMLAEAMLAEGARPEGPSRLAWDSAAALLALRLLRLSGRSAPERARGGLAGWQLKRTTEYLAARLAEEVSLESLAAVAQLSPFHFARAFKQSTGLPPHRYQLALRVEKAKELLALTDLPVIEVAAAVGYEFPQTLARLFRREVGESPTEYRRKRKA